MVRELHKFGMRSSDVTKLSGSKFWEIGLGVQQKFRADIFSRIQMLT